MNKYTISTLMIVLILTISGCTKMTLTGKYELCGRSGLLYELKSDGSIVNYSGLGTGTWKTKGSGIVVSGLSSGNGEWERVFGLTNSKGQNTPGLRRGSSFPICQF